MRRLHMPWKSSSSRFPRSLSPGWPRISSLDVTGNRPWADIAPNSNTSDISRVSCSFAGVLIEPSDISSTRPSQKTRAAPGRLRTAGEFLGMKMPSGCERSFPKPSPPSPTESVMASPVPISGRWHVMHPMFRFPLRILSNASAWPRVARSRRTGGGLGRGSKPCSATSSRTSLISSSRRSSGVCESQAAKAGMMITTAHASGEGHPVTLRALSS